jgi:small conductance mechanosensitive channel
MDSVIDIIFQRPWAAQLSSWSLRLVAATLIVALGLWLARLLVKGLLRLLTRLNVDPMLRDFLRSVASGMLSVVVVVAALDQIGVPMTSILTALGAAGLAVALALRDSLANLAAGVTLILLKPFRVGDVIGIDGSIGTVDGMRLMHTRVITPDNCELVLPNSHVASQPILNYTARATRRVDLSVGIAYRNHIGDAFEVITRVLAEESRVLPEPAPQLLVEQLGDSSVELSIRAWVATPDVLATRAQLLRNIKEALGAADIDIPFPQRELRIIHEKAPVNSPGMP